MDAALVAGDPWQEFHGVSIDTRTLAAGDLFIAIRGERLDGAEFAEAAIEKGAAGVVVPRGWSAKALAERVVLEVEDTTVALQALGQAIRRESGTKVVAITGSAGKTTTKEVAAEFLAARYRVVRNRGNFNNHIGLPLSLVELRQRPEIAVVELGMNHPGEISTLVRVAEPDVRVWTNVGEAHLGFFASVDAIADAKAEIFEGASPSTLLVANADEDRIVARRRMFAGRVVTFGIERDADVRASAIVDRGIDGTTARVTTPRGSVELTTPLVGRGNLENILAATAVAEEFDVQVAIHTDTINEAGYSYHPLSVVIDRALRDEGTSYHYLPPSDYSEADAHLVSVARGALMTGGIPARMRPTRPTRSSGWRREIWPFVATSKRVSARSVFHRWTSSLRICRQIVCRTRDCVAFITAR
jgi:UDP-N-acetylmuramyl pentapeptide synthase